MNKNLSNGGKMKKCKKFIWFLIVALISLTLTFGTNIPTAAAACIGTRSDITCTKGQTPRCTEGNRGARFEVGSWIYNPGNITYDLGYEGAEEPWIKLTDLDVQQHIAWPVIEQALINDESCVNSLSTYCGANQLTKKDGKYMCKRKSPLAYVKVLYYNIYGRSYLCDPERSGDKDNPICKYTRNNKKWTKLTEKVWDREGIDVFTDEAEAKGTYITKEEIEDDGWGFGMEINKKFTNFDIRTSYLRIEYLIEGMGYRDIYVGKLYIGHNITSKAIGLAEVAGKALKAPTIEFIFQKGTDEHGQDFWKPEVQVTFVNKKKIKEYRLSMKTPESDWHRLQTFDATGVEDGAIWKSDVVPLAYDTIYDFKLEGELADDVGEDEYVKVLPSTRSVEIPKAEEPDVGENINEDPLQEEAEEEMKKQEEESAAKEADWCESEWTDWFPWNWGKVAMCWVIQMAANAAWGLLWLASKALIYGMMAS